MPFTASVESGQSSPSLSSGGGVTAAVGVAVGGGACWAGGTTGVLTSGFSPGSGVGGAAAAEDSSAGLVSAPELLVTITATIAAMIPTTTTAIPMANARRRQ